MKKLFFVFAVLFSAFFCSCGSIVREQYDYIMNAADIESLYNLLSAGAVEVAFIGDKSNTEKLKISEKISSVMIERINKYKELKKIKIDCVSGNI